MTIYGIILFYKAPVARTNSQSAICPTEALKAAIIVVFAVISLMLILAFVKTYRQRSDARRAWALAQNQNYRF